MTHKTILKSVLSSVFATILLNGCSSSSDGTVFTDGRDFAISKLLYDNKDDTNASNDSLVITFNAPADETTLSTAAFSITGGAFDTNATGDYNSTLKTYTITGFTTAMIADVDAAVSGITMVDTVRQAGYPDVLPLSTAVALKAFLFKGLEYGVVKSPDTNKTWIDRNLGASQVATSQDDNQSYGDLYQWGRLADGHQRRDSNNTATLATDINATSSDFITINASPNDWTVDGVDNNGSLRAARWANADGSGVCPVGFSVPSKTVLSDDTRESETNPISNSDTAQGNFLKLPAGGGRQGSDGTFSFVQSGGYWSSSVDSTDSWYFYTTPVSVNLVNSDRTVGFSVRCVKN
ncbi:MAG: hypothetical protein ACI81I_000942 [Arcobacteraceae bacterium]|jgi:uncharacterized protein (TIGR02145 family)